MSGHLQPIFIVAPAQRCGTTLIQRLLSSSPNTLIFGETVANDIHLLTSLYQNKQLMISGPHNTWRDEQIQQVLKGEVNAWIPDLMPEREAYLSNFRQSLESYCAFYQSYIEKQGRSQWGCKMPGWPLPQFSFLLELLPAAKVIYIHRDLEECVISARTINLCLDEPSTQQFRQYYTFNHTEAERRLRTDRVLWIDYRELVNQPNQVIEQLEAFTNARPIDRRVMEHKIANYQ